MQHVRQNMFLHSIYAIAYFCLYAICISVMTKKGIAAFVPPELNQCTLLKYFHWMMRFYQKNLYFSMKDCHSNAFIILIKKGLGFLLTKFRLFQHGLRLWRRKQAWGIISIFICTGAWQWWWWGRRDQRLGIPWQSLLQFELLSLAPLRLCLNRIFACAVQLLKPLCDLELQNEYI